MADFSQLCKLNLDQGRMSAILSFGTAMVPKIPDSKPAAKDKIESVSHMSTTIVMDLSLVSVHSTRWIHRMRHDMNLT